MWRAAAHTDLCARLDGPTRRAGPFGVRFRELNITRFLAVDPGASVPRRERSRDGRERSSDKFDPAIVIAEAQSIS